MSMYIYIYKYAPTVCMSIYVYMVHTQYIYIWTMHSNPATGSVLNPDPKSQCFKGDFVGLIPSSIGALKETKLTLNFGGQGVALDATGCNMLSIYNLSLSLSCGFDSFVHWSIKKPKLTLNFGGQGVVLDATGCNMLSIYNLSLSVLIYIYIHNIYIHT